MLNKLRKITIIIIFITISLCVFQKTYAKYVIEHKRIVANLNIDRTPPVGLVIYSTTNSTNGNVEAMIKVNEPVKQVEGFTLSEDKMLLKKEYYTNEMEYIELEDLSGNKSKVKIVISNIDKDKPVVEIIDITNDNIGYEEYANNTHTITATIKILEANFLNFNEDSIKILLDNNTIATCKKTLIQQNINGQEVTYTLKLEQIQGNGNLSIVIDKGAIKDTFGQVNDKYTKNTDITIDNIKPTLTYVEKQSSSGKAHITVDSNEIIRKVNGWNMRENKQTIAKEFPSNVTYDLVVYDYAQNKSTIKINITKADYINLIYASHNSNVGWSYGYENYDIAGAEAIKINPKYKTEALAFRIEGKADKDFLQARTYIYTYWGEGSYGKCGVTGLKYSYGYNPSKTTWKSMLSEDLVTIDNNKYFQFGAPGINGDNQGDYYGNNPIPLEIALQYNYGISGINLKLKSNDEFAIIYQTLVNGLGWLSPASDGEELMAAYNKPISAIRVALVPISEKQRVIDTWKVDKGTYNLE